MNRDPRRAYQFCESDREKYGDRFWALPHRLGEDGFLRDALRQPTTDAARKARGGGSATSLLPVLALHAFPSRRQDDALLDGMDAPPPKSEWTSWTYLSRRRMAALAGLTKNTVARALEHLTGLGVVETFNPKTRTETGLPKCYYRLSHRLFAQNGEPYSQFSARFIYGGVWAMLPLNSARHLFLIAATMERGRKLTIADLQRNSDLGHRTVHEAINVLTATCGAKQGLLAKKTLRPVEEWSGRHWNPELLNDRAKLREVRIVHWRFVYERIAREKLAAGIAKEKRRVRSAGPNP